MSWKLKTVLLVLGIGILAGGAFIWARKHSRPPVQVVLRLTVSPPGQADYVLSKANSARFKYLLGQVANTKPYLAQKLALERVPNSAVLEVRVGVQNQEEARVYLAAFVDALQTFCGPDVRLAVEKDTNR